MSFANHAQPSTGFRSAAVASGIAREAGIMATSAIIAPWIDVSDDRYARPATSSYGSFRPCNMRSNPT